MNRRRSSALAHLSAISKSLTEELLPHPDVSDARGESGDDFLVGDPGDPVADLAEALDERAQSLAMALAHSLEVILRSGALVGGH